MEEEQELKHVCKFCGKSFSCGRSLGGHMRSHMINDISALADGTKLTKKKLPSLPVNNNGAGGGGGGGTNNTNTTSTETNGYGLRENPKKTWRLADHLSEDTSLLVEKSCKECGKQFQSSKALFGHMKCHSPEKEKEKVCDNNTSLEEQQDSWTSANDNNQKLQEVMDSQSDNETTTTAAPNRRKRSKRRIRYMGTAANSSSLMSFANNNAAYSSSVSEIEQEQEEVAMCLVMLSRDVGQRCGGFNSVAEFSDNNSVFLETNKAIGHKELEIEKLEYDDDNADFKVDSRKSEFSASGISRKGSNKNDTAKKSLQNDECGVELVKNLSKETGLDQAETVFSKWNSSSKRKFPDSFDPELKSDYLKKLTANGSDSNRSTRFECKTCNKVFHSYQALGGHRASHKKTKGCFASRIGSRENSIETELSPPNPTPDCKIMLKSINNENSLADCGNETEKSYGAKKSQGHECPICLKVFPSGQALGGHKRCHLVTSTEPKTGHNAAIQEPIPPIRDFLDLNLPASAEEDSNGGLVGFNPCWIGSNHKHEQPLVGLISN